MSEIIAKRTRAKFKNNARVRAYYHRVLAAGGGRISVLLNNKELLAIQAMSVYAEPIASTIKRVVVEEAQRRGLV